MFEIKCEQSLPAPCRERYNSMAFDGCHFYFTVLCKCKIIKMDSCFHIVKCFDTCRLYNNICYDSDLKCFWASAECCGATLFKLDECFAEIDCIILHDPLIRSTQITGLSYQCCNHCITVAFPNAVLCVNPTYPHTEFLLHETYCAWILGILAVCPFIFTYDLQKNKRNIILYQSDGTKIDQQSVPDDLIIESAVFYPCDPKQDPCTFYVLVSKHGCYSHILKCIWTDTTLCEQINVCNREICDPCCVCNPPSPCGCGCDEVLESIALVEASIAHILNAEGEKLQKVLATTDDFCKIMEVNRCVNQTLIHATGLEQMLYCKLEALDRCCDFCREGSCPSSSNFVLPPEQS